MTISALRFDQDVHHRTALMRLARLGGVEYADMAAVLDNLLPPRRQSARSGLPSEGGNRNACRLLLDGWLARVRVLSDGRRQAVELFLPGDLIEVGGGNGVPGETVTALTAALSCGVRDCVWEDEPFATILRRANQLARVALHNHIQRLGRQSAFERLGHFLLELRERQEQAGLDLRGGIAMPLTQEQLGEILGLTTVHVNRTLQQLRREGMVRSNGRGLELLDPVRLAEASDYAGMSRPPASFS